MTVFLTKHWATQGIVRTEQEPNADGYVVLGKAGWSTFHGKASWARNLAAAQKIAQTKRDKKIATLQKEIDRLRALTFD